MSTSRIISAATTAALLWACGTSAPLEVGSRFARAELISAETGGGFTLTEEDAPGLAGVSIRVPAGALSKDATITVEPADDLPAQEAVAWVGPAVEFGPSALELTQPVYIQLRVD